MTPGQNIRLRTLCLRVQHSQACQGVFSMCSGGLTEEESMQQKGQVKSPVLSYTMVHNHLSHEDHRYVTPTENKQAYGKRSRCSLIFSKRWRGTECVHYEDGIQTHSEIGQLINMLCDDYFKIGQEFQRYLHTFLAYHTLSLLSHKQTQSSHPGNTELTITNEISSKQTTKEASIKLPL